MARSRWALRMGLTLVLLGVVASGCGGSACEGYCEEAASCENSEVPPGDNCVSACEEAIENDPNGCGEELEDMLDCVGDADDPCEPNECLSEALAYLDCAGFDDD